MSLFLGLIWSILSVWFNQTNETNQIDKMNHLVLSLSATVRVFSAVARLPASHGTFSVERLNHLSRM
jgi:hypothetical protein